MCFGIGNAPRMPDPAPPPPAPEPVPEMVEAPTAASQVKDQLKIKRKGLQNFRTDLNIPTKSGSGLNVPQ